MEQDIQKRLYLFSKDLFKIWLNWFMTNQDTKQIRQGEELNEANLLAFLRENLDLKSGEIKILQFPAGSSNLTYLIKIDDAEFVLRRPPFGNKV